jgi:hypothetical protein
MVPPWIGVPVLITLIRTLTSLGGPRPRPWPLDQDDTSEDYDTHLDRECDLESLIARTMPTTPEGLAIVATVLLKWYRDVESCPEVEDQAGATLARYILAGMPADVLARAGVEA